MKVFCIGLNKTGTRSLHDALELLGLSGVHWGGREVASAAQRGPEIKAAVERALAEGRPLLDDLDEADAYSDILALSENFVVLDEQYPGSKFILTTRDVDDWLASRRRHAEQNQTWKASGQPHGNLLEIDEPAWREEWFVHTARVTAYFAGRPDDLLIMDVVAGDGWEQLCPFLGLPVPDCPFPRRG